MKTDEVPSEPGRFPIVGIGASAGGLVALEQFLMHVPLHSGMAFVIVQHLDPHRESMLVELLQRHSAMPVVEVKDPMRIETDHVYVIPPGSDLALVQGVLHLLDPPEPPGLRLSIDTFFKSLADDCQHYGIGVILSGMGSDGMLGLRAIRQAAGAGFVQAPATAQFDSMPRSAIDAGVADVVAPPEELPGKIVTYVARIQLGAHADTEGEVEPKVAASLDQVISFLRTQTGHDFSPYKKCTLSRRIERRMGLHLLARISDYLRYLRENSRECELLLRELLIGVTSFFRDPLMWEKLKTDVIPTWIANHPDGATLRAWIPGCSTGEEAYSLAMIFREAIEEANPLHRVSLQIFATDLDKNAIAIGRIGVYPRNIAGDVSGSRLSRFFVEDAGGYRVCNQIREMVIFAEQNIIVDPPFTKMDVLCCRNLLIYLEPDLQGKLIQLCHYSLNPGGFLVLGSAESIGTAATLFSPLSATSRIYRRLDVPVRALPIDFPAAFGRARSREGAGAALAPAQLPQPPNFQQQVEKVLLQQYSPAAVLVNEQGNMLYFSGKTGRYLEPAIGRPNLNLFAMVRDGLNQPLTDVFHRALREKTVATLKGVKVMAEGAAQHVDVVVQPLQDPPDLRGMALIVFKEVASPLQGKSKRATVDIVAADAHVQQLAQELQHAREEAKCTREEMQTSQEALTLMNEELHSTNDELITSREEMQSMNEELQTVNHELQTKVTELSATSNDMKNLLESTEIATLFLDGALNVRRFTASATRLTKLIPGDIGRPITDIVTSLNYPEMAHDAHHVLDSLVFREKDVATTDGHWFRVRIMPYRTLENRMDGLVITFFDITANKALEVELHAAKAALAALSGSLDLQGVGHGVS